MAGQWHSGELRMQRQAGVEHSERMRGAIRDHIPPTAAQFLAQQPMAVIATENGEGWPRASLATGPRGFLQAPDARTLWIGTDAQFDPTARDQMHDGAPIGLLIIDFATRRRMRLNGNVVNWPGGGIAVQAREVYANCPKYIQVRHLEVARPDAHLTPKIDDALTATHQQIIARADTMFIATRHPAAGPDASHRGGQAGFVHVKSPHSLTMPDYAGNLMYQTLGNLLEDDRLALLVPDFETGDTLHLTGRGTITHEVDANLFPGAERLIHIQVENVETSARALPFRGPFVESSPFNPKVG